MVIQCRARVYLARRLVQHIRAGQIQRCFRCFSARKRLGGMQHDTLDWLRDERGCVAAATAIAAAHLARYAGSGAGKDRVWDIAKMLRFDAKRKIKQMQKKIDVIKKEHKAELKRQRDAVKAHKKKLKRRRALLKQAKLKAKLRKQREASEAKLRQQAAEEAERQRIANLSKDEARARKKRLAAEAKAKKKAEHVSTYYLLSHAAGQVVQRRKCLGLGLLTIGAIRVVYLCI